MPTSIEPPERRFRRSGPYRDPVPLKRLVTIASIVTVLVVGVYLGWRYTRVDADLSGLDGETLTLEDAEALSFRIDVSPARLAGATLTFNGEDILDQARTNGGVIRWAPGEPLDEGEYRLALTVPRPLLGDATIAWEFTVDSTPPRIDVPPYLPPHAIDEPVDIEGTVDGADQLLVNGEAHDIGDDGSFRLEFDAPPTGPIAFTAIDRTGNRRQVDVYVPVEYPDDVRGVHVTHDAWNDDELRQGVLALVEAGLVNNVVLTIKDEGGIVGHESDVPLANDVGASVGLYELDKQVAAIHERGARVIGRIVAFRDPKLADHAWEAGDRDFLIQSPDGERYGKYGGGFTNFMHPEVQQYNIDLAREAVEAGVDDILWDYVRRPDGYLEEMVIPGLEGTPEEEVTEFLQKSHEVVRELGAVQGASVFGIAASRPEQIAQDILQLASHSDYIAPMLYPSHWNKGEYGLDDPDARPYEIIKRSLADFKQQVARTGRPLVPWLQHFSLRTVYTERELRAQIRAAEEMGSSGWLMWDPGVTYNPDGLRLRPSS